MLQESDWGPESRCAVGIACLDPRDHRCSWVNAALARHLGRTPEDCAGQPLGRLSPELFELCEPHCRKVIADRTGVDGIHLACPGPGGKGETEFVASFYPILDSEGSVAQIGMAIAELRGLSQLEERLHAESSRGELLAGFSMELQEGASNMPALIETVVAEVCTLIGDVTILNLLTEDGEWFDAVGVHARRPAVAFAARKVFRESRQRAAEGLSGMVVATGKSLLLPTIDLNNFRQQVKAEHRKLLDEYRPTSVVIVPLRARGRVLGCLILVRLDSDQPYTEKDRVFLQDLADRAALGLDNAKLHQRVMRDARRATTLAALGWALSQEQTSYETLLETLVEMVASEMRDLCMVTLLGEDGSSSRVHAVYHEDERLRRSLKDRLVEQPQPDEKGLTTIMTRRPHTLYVDRLSQETIEREGIAEHLAEFEGTGWQPHSLISVALHARDRVIGTLTIARDAHPEPYGTEDRLLVESVAEWAAFKIENARLYQNLQETIETLEAKAQELAGANRRLREEFEQRSKMGAALAASEAKLRAVLDTAVDAIVTIERNGHVQSFNRGAEALFGYKSEDVIGRDVTTLMPKTYWIEESDLERMIGPCREAVARRKDGSTFPAEVSVSRVDLAEGEVLYTVILRDITERKRAAEEAHRAAFEDPLTGLANRRLLLDHLEQAVLRSERTGQSAGVLYLDLDRFSVTNDALGHGVGDQVLRLVGNRLRMVMRPQDTVARIGSDEFVLLLDDLDEAKQAVEMGQRLLELLRVPVFVGGQELFLSASIGIAIKGADSESAQDMMRFAEMAVRRAKEKGRARCVLFDETERAALTRELPQEYDLHRALDQGEFEIRFQPIVDLKTMKTVALEALLRWNWRGQILSPVSFIEMAEESGMIVPIGEWVLRTATRSVREWDKEHGTRLPLRVHVNVSARQLNDMSFPDRVQQILTETGFTASRLSLELTETTLIEDPERARTQLTRIADLGVRLAIDDFGTGYSSLTYLMAYPVHEVKIDKSFIQDINVHATRATLVESIIHLTHRLGMQVVAEGVETEDQLHPLVGFGCDLAQGYLFGRPIPTDAIRAQLRQIFPLVDRVR